MADYPEQVLATGVKYGKHYPICQVPPDQRENMRQKWEFRTHQYTQQQIRRQNKDTKMKRGEMAVHEFENFAWDHAFVNIHSILMVDILHQLLKRIVMRLIEWCTELIEDRIEAKGVIRQGRGRKRNTMDAGGKARLDQRFRKVPAFSGLKRFDHFSSVKQWTGNEQKAIVRQLIPVIAPLLVPIAPAAVNCARGILDFVMLSMYSSHDENTLEYI